MTGPLGRSVAIVGGLRTPFCRSNGAYAELGNTELLAACLQPLVEKYDLTNQKVDELLAGSVISHVNDWNLARQAVADAGLSASTPATTLQQACGTSLQALFIAAAKISSGQIDSAIVAGADTASDPPIELNKSLSKRLLRVSKAKKTKGKLAALKGFSLGELKPVPPANTEAATGLSMGQHCELMAQEWGIGRPQQDELALLSHSNAARAYESGFFNDLIVPCAGIDRDDNIRENIGKTQLAALKPCFEKSEKGTLTAANSTTLTDGASGVLLASEQWARERGLPILCRLTHCRTAAINHIGGDGLLMAPVNAVIEMLDASGLEIKDFDFFEIHEAFAAQVLCTIKAFADSDYCTRMAGKSYCIGELDTTKLNVHGSSLATGHPFAATGARITGVLAKLLAQQSKPTRGLISVCTAGGMGLSAVLES